MLSVGVTFRPLGCRVSSIEIMLIAFAGEDLLGFCKGVGLCGGFYGASSGFCVGHFGNPGKRSSDGLERTGRKSDESISRRQMAAHSSSAVTLAEHGAKDSSQTLKLTLPPNLRLASPCRRRSNPPKPSSGCGFLAAAIFCSIFPE
jgi:hypothetical protein